ncbi:hypothetical protein Tco_0603354 [Tanacetum coccineum]
MRYGGICFHCKYDTNLNSLNFSDYPPQPQYETNICELCGNDAHYGYDCPPQVPFDYNQNQCFNQNFNCNFPQTLPSYENCRGPYETFQCQPVTQNFYNSNSSGFDQFQPPQFSVTHQLPQRSNKDMLLEMAKLIKNNRTLFNSDIFPHEEMSIRALLAKERILKLIQVWDEEQIKPWSLPELLLQLSNYSKTINESLKQREEKRIESEQAANLAVQKEQEEHAAQSFTLNWNFPMIDDDDDDYTTQYKEYLERSSKAITPDLPTVEPDNSLIMRDKHLSIIPKEESDEVIKSSVENLVPIPSESKGISDDICCDVPFCDNNHFDAELGLIDSLLSRDISITSPKSDFLPEEFAGELDLIDPILPGIDEDDFDKEEGAIDIDILQLEDEILREKFLNVNLLIDKIEALNLTPSIPFVLEYPSSSPILVVDSDFLIEEVDTFLVSEDSIPPGIESDFDSEGTVFFLTTYLTMILLPRGGEIVFSPNVKDDNSFTFFIRTFLPFLTYPEVSPLLLSTGSEDTILTPTSPLRAGGISSGWNFHDVPDFEDSRAHGFVHSYIRASYPQLYLGNPIS